MYEEEYNYTEARSYFRNWMMENNKNLSNWDQWILI